jgi:hypothetical protein
MTRKIRSASPPQGAPVVTQPAHVTPVFPPETSASGNSSEPQPYSGDWFAVLFWAFCFFLLLLLNLLGLLGPIQFR